MKPYLFLLFLCALYVSFADDVFDPKIARQYRNIAAKIGDPSVPQSPAPTNDPTVAPTDEPTAGPTAIPTSYMPTAKPTRIPTKRPTRFPTVTPSTAFPTVSSFPTSFPTTNAQTRYFSCENLVCEPSNTTNCFYGSGDVVLEVSYYFITATYL
jgi:hypothetical protein